MKKRGKGDAPARIPARGCKNYQAPAAGNKKAGMAMHLLCPYLITPAAGESRNRHGHTLPLPIHYTSSARASIIQAWPRGESKTPLPAAGFLALTASVKYPNTHGYFPQAF